MPSNPMVDYSFPAPISGKTLSILKKTRKRSFPNFSRWSVRKFPEVFKRNRLLHTERSSD